MSARHAVSVLFLLLFAVFLSTCKSSQSLTTPASIPTVTKAEPAAIQETALPTPTTHREPTATFEPYSLPLSEYGPHFIGKRYYDFQDTSRDNRPVDIAVWYPAIKPVDFAGAILENAEPNRSGGPYPLILSSAKVAGIFGPHLVSHGFVVVGVRNIDTYSKYNNSMTDQPLDILFALDQVGMGRLTGIDEVIDSSHAGTMGYSFDGYNSLAMSGARIDPDHFLSGCSGASNEVIHFDYSMRWQCPLINQWDEFVENAGKRVTETQDGLWQPMTDPRIRAVMPMAPDGWLLFGQQGLKAVDRSVLIIVGTNDVYYKEDILIYKHLGTPDRFLVSFVGQNHMMIYSPVQITHMKHFAAAFFGHYLQGLKDYAAYFSEDFLQKYPALDWIDQHSR